MCLNSICEVKYSFVEEVLQLLVDPITSSMESAPAKPSSMYNDSIIILKANGFLMLIQMHSV